MEELTEAEETLYFWQMGSSGSFTTNLFKSIACADTVNLSRLAMGFPAEVQVYKRYANEDGYWQNIRDRMERKK